MSVRSRRGFSSLDLLTLIVLLTVVMAILQPALQQSREAARRSQCINNLKHVGLAIHNFHDIRQEICPSYLSTDTMPTGPCNAQGYATWNILLLDYMEQAALYERVDLKTPLTTDSPEGKPANAHKLVRGTAVATYYCPSRRDPPQLTPDGEGVVGDYANVSYGEGAQPTRVNRAQPRTFDGAMVVCRAFNASDQPNTTNILGLAPGTLKPGDFRSMTSFASVLDGLSNTAFIGEKAVHQDRLGQGKLDGSQQDGTIYYGVGPTKDSYTAPGPMAYWSRRLAPEKEGDAILPSNPRTDDPNNRFGGWHPGVTLFILGDGSYRPVRLDESNTALQCLGTRNDRMTFQLK
jgi:hypothetical protein